MLKQLLLVGFICVALGSRAAADSLTAQLFPLTGEVRFRNTSASDVPFVFYSISSATLTSGALNSSPSIWKSITDNYDVSGNGFIDPVENWSKLSATSTRLEEGVFFGPGGSLAAKRSVSLGNIWNPGVVPYTNLAFDIEQDSQPVTVSIQLALAGDYFVDGVVDQQDYLTWRQNMGSTSQLDADGNLNGVVDAADYVIWRQNFGNMLPGSGLSTSAGGLVAGFSVPEPAAIGLAVLGFVSLALRRKRRS